MPRILVIISTSDVDQALAGLMYATNALKYGWVEDVELIFFGPVERHIASGNKRIINAIMEFSKHKKKPLACKRIAELGGYIDKLEEKIETVYVGSKVSELIKKGYMPMVF